MQLTKRQIKSIRNFFSDKPVVCAYLFGCYDRGEAAGKSDIDILVDLNYTKPIGLEFVTMVLDLEEMFEKKDDLVSSREISKYIVPHIEMEKKLIYE